MTTPERLLAVAGVTLVASAALLVAYLRQSNPADAQATGCASQRALLSQTLDQVRFSTSAAHAAATALHDTATTKTKYADMIVALRRSPDIAHLPAASRERVREDLAQASWILDSQDEPLHRAAELLGTDQRQLASAMPLISQASADIREDDCPALSLAMSSSGWPKDRLILELSEASRLSAEVNDKLETVLGLVLDAQNAVHPQNAATK
jgi:hypothetical protein